jgi:hypothetical protein
MTKIQGLYRYPIKGLGPEPLNRIALTPGQTIPGDRLYAIENGPSGFDPAAPAYLSKTHFLMLMKNERLARLRSSFDQDSHMLIIRGGKCEVRGNLRTATGRAGIERFFADYCAGELRGAPKILHVDGHSFSDVARKVVSIINLSSVAAIESMIGAPVHPLRFRGNVYVEGLSAWSELELVGKELKVGRPSSDRTVRLKVVKRTVRCAATNVDPDTGARDLEVPKTLLRQLGHADCGIYAEVVEGGEIAPGDQIEIL